MTTDANVMATDPTKAAEGGATTDKGKGKAAAVEEEHPVADQEMGDAMNKDDSEDDDEEEEEEEEEEEGDDDEPVAEDGLEEIDPSNIIGGRRTRGRVIDFAKAAEETPVQDGDEDDEDDDFIADDDKMDED